MKKGEVVEQVIRRSYINLSDLARKLRVSRRTLYNWFSQDDLDIEVISRIGDIIHHDFSKDFPELYERFGSYDSIGVNNLVNDMDSAVYWRNKYISLLEKHNAILINVIV